MEEIGRLFTVNDIARMTSLTDRTIRNHLRSGVLAGRKVGGQWRFTEEDVKRFMDRGEAATSIEKEQKRMVQDFMDGLGTEDGGRLQVCTVADLYVSQQEAREKSDALCALVNETRGEDALRYQYSYARAKGRARYVLFASPEFLQRALDLLKQ